MKKGPGLLDTGPLVSFLAAGLSHSFLDLRTMEVLSTTFVDL
jgi:hypothetical protein